MEWLVLTFSGVTWIASAAILSVDRFKLSPKPPSVSLASNSLTVATKAVYWGRTSRRSIGHRGQCKGNRIMAAARYRGRRSRLWSTLRRGCHHIQGLVIRTHILMSSPSRSCKIRADTKRFAYIDEQGHGSHHGKA